MELLLPEDFKEFLKLLNENQVRYLVVGGIAVALHGYPRATGDMDIWVDNNELNAELLTKVCREFGFTGPELKPELFKQSNTIARMGVPPLRIELMTSMTGLEFSECYPRRVFKKADGMEIPVIDIDNLLKNKKLIRRNKDLDDIENLS